MARSDTRFGTYLKAFFSDWVTGMTGPLSAPFGAAAVFTSGLQRAIWGALAVVAAVVGAYQVWRKARLASNLELERVTAIRDAEITMLKERVAELSRNPWSENVERHVRQVVCYAMNKSGQLLLRWLLIQGRIENQQKFVPDISLESQFQQMDIAVKNGLVRLDQSHAGAFYVVNPETKAVLQKVVSEVLASDSL